MRILFLLVPDLNNHLTNSLAQEGEEQQPGQHLLDHLDHQVVKTIGLLLIEECVGEVVVEGREVQEEEI